ncbi:Arc family DNA-binding protein [Xenorhabdus bovienii]|uniref:Arc family DNA-binding protein n=1 Tax=Xenorhabdus bovienii TaxID=40576 RepID=A0AAJ1MXR9_XENBV|nr:Arc family DNA-binding protein [Xenorhabdus bovienii]MDE1486752.1 Arc family DNA-binding protein [Xenorhabdus bovienii]MDE9477304.1 Arc family DNA-binding protein [Xenorhabdus bovienii]MDE9509335.1 Arc family DNA-binding protein [Xenorhabdus bovienii]MDE9520980.1 Arc family DNA-binding protein [Xenorhabdus bovienii]
MSREDAQMKIRLPAELKEKLEKEATENNRSMNAEVLQRLSKSFEKSTWVNESKGFGFITPIDPEFVDQMDNVVKTLRAMTDKNSEE